MRSIASGAERGGGVGGRDYLDLEDGAFAASIRRPNKLWQDLQIIFFDGIIPLDRSVPVYFGRKPYPEIKALKPLSLC